MRKIVVKTDAGKIKIRLREGAKATANAGSAAAEAAGSIGLPRQGVILPGRLINYMEIRAESVFRPGEEDVEIVYALSGTNANVPDMLHKLSSTTVVADASPSYVTSYIGGMIDHIRKERGGEPELIVQIHTHPQGLPYPSETDKQFYRNTSEVIRQLVPEVNIIFGIHAVSSEAIRKRQEPSKTAKNKLEWASITRIHEVGFYTEDAQPCEVSYDR
ncbi:Mov34/MPN/PAD-1 family protein [Chloroflexota bacterium]